MPVSISIPAILKWRKLKQQRKHSVQKPYPVTQGPAILRSHSCCMSHERRRGGVTMMRAARWLGAGRWSVGRRMTAPRASSTRAKDSDRAANPDVGTESGQTRNTVPLQVLDGVGDWPAAHLTLRAQENQDMETAWRTWLLQATRAIPRLGYTTAETAFVQEPAKHNVAIYVMPLLLP